MFTRLNKTVKENPVLAALCVLIALTVWSWLPKPLNPRFILTETLGPRFECGNGFYSWLAIDYSPCEWQSGIRHKIKS